MATSVAIMARVGGCSASVGTGLSSRGGGTGGSGREHIPQGKPWYSHRISGKPRRKCGAFRSQVNSQRPESSGCARRSDIHDGGQLNADIWHAFLEAAPAGVAIFDRDMRYLQVSARWIRDYGLEDRGDIIGRSHYEVFPDISEHWRAIHRRCLAGAVERSDAEPFARADGQTDWVCWEIRPWHHADGDIGGITIFS